MPTAAATLASVESYELTETAERAGLSLEDLARLVDLGIVSPDAGGRFTPGDVRRAGLINSFTTAGIPLDSLGAEIRAGRISLGFLDEPAYERFSALSRFTFAQLSEQTGVPVDLLLLIREASGSSPASADDRVREGELAYASFLAVQVGAGFNPLAIERLLRAAGDAMRRLAETGSAWWRTEVMLPAMAAGKQPDELFGNEFATTLNDLAEEAVVELYRMQQAKTWTANIIEVVETSLSGAGLHSRLEHPPAMCFLDITGYTRLTQERGDEAAADLADHLGRLSQRTSLKYGGRPVKSLGDGVMFYFPDPGPGVVAALDMVDGVAAAGLPPAHVGLHVGPVIFQEGDYYGATVNVAARIAEYDRPGEVLVSQEVVDACAGAAVVFREIGPVELKGVGGTMRLYAASRAT